MNRWARLLAAAALATSLHAQQKDQEQYPSNQVQSGQTYTFYDRAGSGTITLEYAISVASAVSISVQGCSVGGTCVTLTPVTGTNPYTGTSSTQVQFLGGYANYKVTPTFTGGSIGLYKVGIQAKLGVGGGGGGGATIPATTSVLKGDGSGNGAAAVPGTDYVIPSGTVANASSLNPTIADLKAIAAPQAMYFPYLNGSAGTSFVDQSGNNYNCTLGGGGSAPTFDPQGNARFLGGQYCTTPAAAFTGMQTVVMWFKPDIPNINDAQSPAFYVSTDGNQGIGARLSQPGGLAEYVSGGSVIAQAIERFAGNTSYALVNPASGASTMYHDGALTSLLAAGRVSWACTTQCVIGVSAASLGQFGASFKLMGLAVYAGALTPAQIRQIDVMGKQLITANTGVRFASGEGAFQPNIAYMGDSIYANQGNTFTLISSPPYIIHKSAGMLANGENYLNPGFPGETGAGALSNITRYWDALDKAIGPVTAFVEYGTNDITGSQSAATTFSSVTGICTAVKARYKYANCIVSTIPPRFNNTTAQEVQRVALNNLIYSGFNPGTSVYDGINDLAADPILATQVAPNLYQPTGGSFYNVASGGTAQFNGTYSADGIHPKTAANVAADPVGALPLLDVTGQLFQPHWVQKVIPAAVLATFANTSQTIPLFQLAPGWQVCGVSYSVTTAFAGPSVTAATFSIVDSTGAVYLNPTSLTAVAKAQALSQVLGASGGMLQIATTSTGANQSVYTAGNLNLGVCIVHPF